MIPFIPSLNNNKKIWKKRYSKKCSLKMWLCSTCFSMKQQLLDVTNSSHHLRNICFHPDVPDSLVPCTSVRGYTRCKVSKNSSTKQRAALHLPVINSSQGMSWTYRACVIQQGRRPVPRVALPTSVACCDH